MMREVWSPGAPGEAHVGSWVVPTASLLGAGWFFALALILGLLVGQWVDEKTGLEPIFTLIGILLGLAVAAVGGYRMLLPFIRKVSYSDSEQG